MRRKRARKRRREKVRRTEIAQGCCEERFFLIPSMRAKEMRNARREREREHRGGSESRIERKTEIQGARPRDAFSHRPILGAHGFGAGVSLFAEILSAI